MSDMAAFRAKHNKPEKEKKHLIHPKITASINSCINKNHLITCMNFRNLPGIKNSDQKKELIMNLIKLRALNLKIDFYNEKNY